MNLKNYTPETNSGLYFVTVFYTDEFHKRNTRNQRSAVDFYLPDLKKALDILEKNRLVCGRNEFLQFFGDKQKLIDLIFEGGIVKSDLFRSFILGNNQDYIYFYFNFQNSEDIKNMLYEKDFSIEFVNDIVDEPLANRLILLNKIESLYLGQVDKLRDIISYHQIKGLPFEVIVLGLMEMFPNEDSIREVLMGDVDDGHQEERGFYSVIASIFINHPQALADQSSQIHPYFPYSTLPRILTFRGDKVRLMEEVQARGLSQSNIFKNFVAQNELKNIGFQYCFIGLDALERALPSEWHTSVCTTILRHLTEDEVQFLRNEFSLNYCSDFRKYGQLGFRKCQKSKSDFHYHFSDRITKKRCMYFIFIDFLF